MFIKLSQVVFAETQVGFGYPMTDTMNTIMVTNPATKRIKDWEEEERASNIEDQEDLGNNLAFYNEQKIDPKINPKTIQDLILSEGPHSSVWRVIGKDGNSFVFMETRPNIKPQLSLKVSIAPIRLAMMFNEVKVRLKLNPNLINESSFVILGRASNTERVIEFVSETSPLYSVQNFFKKLDETVV